ncbi:MAG: hypothetical protein GWM98_14825, partial [Nitrospinaceae bacterium]|nr:hypothetical protein [Nitrospinaceae bacterium]NIR55520.1 hypothetical protein [Nitrospinaceae bacterium]NIS85951.1 hypothetical protein [Nitrospinaceae bacterium]NIT82800.1 hypothetical protein [Nitrospinaceae bacterium]NIU45002.1 hypothetical protein [Nitrospinaceae bacterium]
EGDQVDCWVEAPYLCVDLHHKDRKRRRARRIPLTLPPTRPGTLFNGFTRTPHADVQVVMYTDPGVEEFEVKEESYREKGLEELDGRSFWRRT